MYQSLGKRFLDLVLSICAVILLMPLILLVSFLIKVSDPGPIIFRQNRVGRGGKLFTFFKFRSMPVNTGDIPSDEIGRIELTVIGRFIRRTNLDELPQLVNIVRGDMSFVGPRPSLPSQTELLESRALNGACMCRPGLTGLAQISSFDGMSVQRKAHLDGLYAAHITLINDVIIIFKTFGYLLRPPPTY